MAPTCMFCNQEAGSEEHVFLAALGGRVATRNAICLKCNNHFSNASGDDVDGALATSLLHIRSALNIWTGRGKPPPTIQRAGVSPSGVAYDLAPGLVPVSRPASIPKDLQGGAVTINARDVDDAKRTLEIVKKKAAAHGLKAEPTQIGAASEKVGTTTISFSIDGPKCMRSLAKTAITGACLLYGNENVAPKIDHSFKKSVFSGTPPVHDYGWWDFNSPWPNISNIRPHPKSPDATASDFDHSLVFCDVGNDWVAYVSLFGSLRASFRLGAASGLPARGLACNPRRHGRLMFDVVAPLDWTLPPRAVDGSIERGIGQALTKVGETWQKESIQQRAEQAAQELAEQIVSAGDDEAARNAAIQTFSEKFAAVEAGATWEEKLDPIVFDS